MERLRELRDRQTDNAAEIQTNSDTDVPDSLRAEALLVYQSLARRLTHRAADATQTAVEKQIRNEFRFEELVLTDRGWMKSGKCFQGPARPFTLTGADIDPLWLVLGIPEPALALDPAGLDDRSVFAVADSG
ncbi:hypothetical protein [Streptomyces sp. G-G2]|uniref:hypothetical protein n=1 Tax=Streptomyces sp. G-G2 TaxID=3046201 RepID=UPI0024BB322B|nr:hypothetical protein [Streptomyces sp. G-G2]MDJ0380111.1 hypothetical protein [Streptomyces sp. G-G2]